MKIPFNNSCNIMSFFQVHFIKLEFSERSIHDTASDLYERDALFRNYSHSLEESVINYNWLKTNTREEEFNLILEEVKDTDQQLEKAERILNWNSDGNKNIYIFGHSSFQ